MPLPTPFHPRTSARQTSYRWKEWAGHFAVCSYDFCHEAEYMALRHAATAMDASPLFKIDVSGPDAAEFLAFLWARDPRKLAVGRMGYGCLTDEEGKVVDDGTIARLGDSEFRCTTAAPSLGWFQRHAGGFNVVVRDVTETLACLAVQGPQSRGVLAGCCEASAVEDLGFFDIAPARIGSMEIEVSRTGYTGDLGYEVWCRAEDACAVWDAVFEAGAPHGLAPMGLDALDVSRVEAGFILQDVDYFSATRALIDSRKSSPFELGLGWSVHIGRGPYLGSAALAAEKAAGSPWAFVGLEIDWEELEGLFDEHGLPPALPTSAWRTPVPVYGQAGGSAQVGQATSGAWSPLLKRNLALATVQSASSALGTRLQIEQTVEFERRTVTATVVERPFFDPERKRS